MIDDSAWLVEHSGELLDGTHGSITWLCISTGAFDRQEITFTHDIDKALRFARKEDAEAMLAMHLGPHPPEWYRKPYSVTEHNWCAL